MVSVAALSLEAASIVGPEIDVVAERFVAAVVQLSTRSSYTPYLEAIY